MLTTLVLLLTTPVLMLTALVLQSNKRPTQDLIATERSANCETAEYHPNPFPLKRN